MGAPGGAGAFTAAGQPPARAGLKRLARAHGGNPGAVLGELAGADVLAFTADGKVRAAYPFFPAPTPIRVSWAGAASRWPGRRRRCAPVSVGAAMTGAGGVAAPGSVMRWWISR